MRASATLLAGLESIAHETANMLSCLDAAEGLPPSDRREAKRRVLEIRARTQELFEWLSEARLEDPRN